MPLEAKSAVSPLTLHPPLPLLPWRGPNSPVASRCPRWVWCSRQHPCPHSEPWRSTQVRPGATLAACALTALGGGGEPAGTALQHHVPPSGPLRRDKSRVSKGNGLFPGLLLDVRSCGLRLGELSIGGLHTRVLSGAVQAPQLLRAPAQGRARRWLYGGGGLREQRVTPTECTSPVDAFPPHRKRGHSVLLRLEVCPDLI